MKLTRSTGYAIAALCYMATNAKSRYLPARLIAAHFDIPLDYLLKVLKQLARGGIIRSVRGPMGGFSLAEPVDKISLDMIIKAVEGRAESDVGALPFNPDDAISKRLFRTYKQSAARAAEVLAGTTLADLLK